MIQKTTTTTTTFKIQSTVFRLYLVPEKVLYTQNKKKKQCCIRYDGYQREVCNNMRAYETLSHLIGPQKPYRTSNTHSSTIHFISIQIR